MLEHLTSSNTVLLLASIGAARLWYAVPLVASISLVYAATRHEEIGPILSHAVRFAAWIVIFMLLVLVALQAMSWMA